MIKKRILEMGKVGYLCFEYFVVVGVLKYFYHSCVIFCISCGYSCLMTVRSSSFSFLNSSFSPSSRGYTINTVLTGDRLQAAFYYICCSSSFFFFTELTNWAHSVISHYVRLCFCLSAPLQNTNSLLIFAYNDTIFFFFFFSVLLIIPG